MGALTRKKKLFHIGMGTKIFYGNDDTEVSIFRVVSKS